MEVDGQAPKDKAPVVDADWMVDYRRHALEAFIAGVLMCLVSRLSHILSRPGILHHESYMALYAYLTSSLVMPIFIINWRFIHTEDEHKEYPLSDFPIWVKICGLVFLFVLLLIKNFHMERGIMKRFVEDYDPEIHEHFPCFSKSEPANDQIEKSPFDSAKVDPDVKIERLDVVEAPYAYQSN